MFVVKYRFQNPSIVHTHALHMISPGRLRLLVVILNIVVPGVGILHYILALGAVLLPKNISGGQGFQPSQGNSPGVSPGWGRLEMTYELLKNYDFMYSKPPNKRGGTLIRNLKIVTPPGAY